MGKDDNTAGWILTTLVYSLGGRMETGSGTNAKATLNNPQAVTALNMLKKMRWTDNSMGSNFDYGWSDINQAFAAGKIGMYISGSGRLHEPRAGEQHRPEHLRPGADPAREEQDRRRPRRRHARGGPAGRERSRTGAAVKWIDFFYEQPLINKAQAIRNAKTLVAGKQPVGVPALPVFNKAQYDLANTWIKPYINVPQAQMKPFTTGIFNQKLIPEPAGVDAERLPLARRRRSRRSSPTRTRTSRPAAAGEQRRPGRDQPGQVETVGSRPGVGGARPTAPRRSRS